MTRASQSVAGCLESLIVKTNCRMIECVWVVRVDSIVRPTVVIIVHRDVGLLYSACLLLVLIYTG